MRAISLVLLGVAFASPVAADAPEGTPTLPADPIAWFGSPTPLDVPGTVIGLVCAGQGELLAVRHGGDFRNGKTISIFGLPAVEELGRNETQLLQRFDEASPRLAPLMISPNGRRLWSSVGDCDLTTFHVVTSRSEPVLAISHDGRMVVRASAQAGDQQSLVVVDDHQRSLALPVSEHVVAVAFTPDGHFVVAATREGHGRLWNTSDGTQPRKLAVPLRRLSSLAVSPDGRRAAFGDRESKCSVVDLATGNLIASLTESESIRSLDTLAFSPDGKRLAAGGEGSGAVTVWEIESGQVVRSLFTEMQHVGAIAFSPSGDRIVCGGEAKNGGSSIRIWQWEGERELFVPSGPRFVANRLVFSPDGTQLVSRSAQGDVNWWLGASNRWQRTITGSRDGTIRFSLDGRQLGECDERGLVRLYRRDSGELAESRDGDRNRRVTVLSADLQRVAILDGNQISVRLIVNGQAISQWSTERRYHSALALSPRCDRLAMFPDDSPASGAGVEIWDVKSGRLWRELESPSPGSRVTTAAFSPDGLFLAGRMTSQLVCWFVPTGQLALVRGCDQRSLSGEFTFSADSKQLIFGSDGGVEFVELVTGDPCAWLSLERQSGSLVAFAPAPDGASIVTSTSRTHRIARWSLSPFRGAAVLRPLLEVERRELWNRLATDSAGDAYQVIWRFAHDGEATVNWFKQSLGGRPPADEAKRIEQLIGELDSPRFAIRERAQAELLRRGASVLPRLRLEAEQNEKSFEIRMAARWLISTMDRRRGMTLLSMGDEVRRARAVQVLELISSPAARELLEQIAEPGNNTTSDIAAEMARAGLQLGRPWQGLSAHGER